MICNRCKQQYDGAQYVLSTEVRSARIATAVYNSFCSAACRDEWWDTDCNEDLLPYEDAPMCETAGHPGKIYADDVAVAVFRMDADTVSREHARWREVEGVAFGTARDINTWWRSPLNILLQDAVVPCSRDGGFHFLAQPPEHWTLLRSRTKMRLSARVWRALVRLWGLILRVLKVK